MYIMKNAVLFLNLIKACAVDCPRTGQVSLLTESLSFPIWLLMFMPRAWVYLIPALFALCTAALVALFCRYDMTDAHRTGGIKAISKADLAEGFAKWRRCIIPVWLFSFLGCILSAGTLMMTAYVPGIISGEESWWSRKVTIPVTANAFSSFPAFIVTVFSIAFAAYMVYWLNLRFSFRKLEYSDDRIRRLAVWITVITAPYLLLIPSEWLWA